MWYLMEMIEITFPNFYKLPDVCFPSGLLDDLFLKAANAVSRGELFFLHVQQCNFTLSCRVI